MTPDTGRTRDDDELLNFASVAAWLDCSRAQVYRLIRSARPLPVRRMNSVMRVRLGDLREWVRDTPVIGQ
jgi:predicted DNA-binding transcriptional regulator AlpA